MPPLDPQPTPQSRKRNPPTSGDINTGILLVLFKSKRE